jgi:hypothetical protein
MPLDFGSIREDRRDAGAARTPSDDYLLSLDEETPRTPSVMRSIYSDEDLETMIGVLGRGKTNVRDLPDTRRD